MKTSTLRSLLRVLATALGVVCGCGGGNGSSSQPPPAVPAVCETAFDTATDGAVSSAARGAQTELSSVALSSCTRDAKGNVAIGGPGGCGPNVVVDQDFTGAKRLGKITINSGGKLVFPDLADPDLKTPKTLEMETAGIAIATGGLFSVGTAICPIGFHPGARATITFTGDRALLCASGTEKQGQLCKVDADCCQNPADCPSSCKPCDPSKGCDDGSVKGIEVRPGGILRLFGAKGVPNPADPGAGAGSVSWTVLRETVAPQGTKLHLAADVTTGQRPWEKGDWIVVGTSSFSPFETEFVEIAAAPMPDGMGGSTVEIQPLQPLKYSHFGSGAPTPSQLCTVSGKLKAVACGSVAGCTAACTSAPSALNVNDPAAQNFGIDERAEVGLISRSIKLTATTPAAPDANEEPLKPSSSLHWGGEIRVVGGDAPPQVSIVGVELEKFGKDQLGSYPIHLHMLGKAKNAPKIMANSIHHSFNKCITVHMTSDVTIEDNVCARIVGHMFYEEFGSEENVSFQRNLGLGAMSNSFDIYKITTTPPQVRTIPRGQLIGDYWWKGDNLANSAGYNYDGFNIPNTDEQKNPTHGSCQRPDGNGGFGLSQQPYSPAHPTECKPGEIYTEPASGFWITNPTTELIGNAIGGCQGVGRGFWWVTPPAPIMVNDEMQDLKFKPLGAFFDNRGHACYGGFYGEEEYSVASTVLVPHKDGTSTGQPIIAQMDGMTATRNRFRGVWLRPTWFVVKDGRFATNRENVSLVTSGGIDGNAPGVWALLKDSVIAGVSQNNVGRWGPCPTDNALGINTGGQFGCIDHTPPSLKLCATGTEKQGQRCSVDPDCCQNAADCPASCNPTSADEVGLGYPPPSWNMFGYMLYDGPVRVYDDRFVNFRKDVSSLLTPEDNAFLKAYSASHIVATAQRCVAGMKQGNPCGLDSDCPGSTCPKSPFVYEGDAALGWFQSNQSSYPTGTVTRGLSWENTDLRHQIYTDKVSVNLEFNDGDKNTAVIDEDGTLTGYGVTDAKRCSNALSVPCTQNDACPSGGVCVTALLPISLNNLPFNAIANSVDECFSRGQQNANFEGRDSSLISPGSMGTLEFSTLYPWKDKNDDQTDVPFPGPDGDVTHTQFLTFTRDDVSAGGNNMSFHPDMTLHSRDGRGIWEPKVTSGFGYTVAAAPAPNFPQSTGKAGIAHIIDVGVADVVKPDISATNPFFIRLGICYTDANGTHPQDANKFSIVRGYKSYTGGFVDPNDPELLKAWSPSACNNLDSLRTANITEPTCPGERPDGTLSRALTEAEMYNRDQTPNLGKFYYDKDTGMLFLWVAQDEPNPVAPSPLGSCTGDSKTDDPSCPDVAHGETFYACPVKGCHVYVIKLDDPSYSPGASKCTPYEKFAHAPFTTPRQLVLHGTNTAVDRIAGVDTAGQPFHTPSQATDPQCKESVMLAAVSTTQQSTLASAQFGLAPPDPADGRTVFPIEPGTSQGAAVRQHSANTSTSIGAADAASTPIFAPPPTPTATPLPEPRPMTR